MRLNSEHWASLRPSTSLLQVERYGACPPGHSLFTTVIHMKHKDWAGFVPRTSLFKVKLCPPGIACLET